MGGGEREYDWSKEGHRSERGRDNDRQRNYRSYSNDRRSSDYRNDDGYSRNDDYDHSERKYRSQNEYRKDYRERERRSRSRSRSCDRDSRNYEQYEADKSYNRHEDRDRQREKKEVPNNTLMIRNLPLHFTDKDVSTEINKYGLYPKDVRLMKHKETGQSRGFAFIEFATVEHAVQLKELTQGCMVIENEYECSLHFSFPKEAPAGDKNVIKNDWSCPKCGINNFKRRDECFKCGTSKDDPRIFEKPEVVQHPTNGIAALTLSQSSMMHSILKLKILQLRNLSSSTTEERVLTIIGTLTSLPIKSIRIAQDPVSQKNMCILELHSVLEATQLFHVISSMTTGFVIDDSLVSLAYGPRADISSVAANSFGSQNAAMAALAAAQWKNLDDSSSKGKQTQVKTTSLGSITLNGVEYPKHAAPNYASFQLDASSGYYYDASTGFYYDSSSQYFYNSQTQKYMYYDSANQIYVSVDSAGQATATNMTPTVNSSTLQNADAIKKSVDDNISKQQDKVKTAKKIAKDMEKWAKTLNQKKEIAKPLAFSQAETVPMESSSSISNSLITETVSSVLEKPVSNLEQLTIPTTAPIVSAISVDPFEIIRIEEDKRIDWDRLVCHLCRRQFSSKEQLEKHKDLSGLHKQNLVALHPSILTEDQLEHVESVERGYRDRAKERREKFGVDDTPEFSKKKLEKMKEPVETMSAEALPITNDNLGSKMLKAMGWTEGSGLGKSNQGTADIIQVERRRGGLGLGNNNATFTRESYKDAVRRTALARFKELSEG